MGSTPFEIAINCSLTKPVKPLFLKHGTDSEIVQR